MKPQKFSATIYKIGINYAVDVPLDVSLAFNMRCHIPVAGTLNDYTLKATLVSVGEERHRLFINREMRNLAGVGEGDAVEVSVSLDTEPRTLPMPREFQEVLERNKEAKDAFEKLPQSHQKEILVYLNSLKNPETLKRNVEKAINSHLLSKK